MFDNNTKALISLSCQMIKHAGSGHTGMAISSAPIHHALFANHLNISSRYPKWFNRDRFVLSAGHGSATLYAMLHFLGKISMDEIKSFRKGNAKVAGHPEYAQNNYIDASTGPLGQGIANAVGMAIAEKYLAKRWSNLKGLVDHYTYCLVGDGDLQEGISYEAASLAGKLKLNKLIVLYDSNDYQLDSSVKTVNIDDIKTRFEAHGWKYMISSNEVSKISDCINNAKTSDRPTIIEIKTIIGEGTSKSASNKAHGLTINDQEMKAINRHFDMNFNMFEYPNDFYTYFQQNVFNRGDKKYNDWYDLINYYRNIFPEELDDFLNKINGHFEDFSSYFDIDEIEKFDDATKSYLKVFFRQLSHCKDIITLSADLASTTNCKICADDIPFNEDESSPYIMTGVREFAMGAVQNGILLHGGLRSCAGTFLSFSDYIKPAIRVGAMCKLPSTYIFTHDSYFVGNDGPTHQPYDQIPMLRAINNVYVWRPCDEHETLAALSICLNERSRTNCLVLTRQSTKSLDNTKVNDTYYGAYVLEDVEKGSVADLTIVANGSEIELAYKVKREIYNIFNIHTKIVSCPCLKEFLNQNKQYITNTLRSEFGVITIEASSDCYWYELSKYCSKMLAIRATDFGFSDDGATVYSKMGFNLSDVVEKVKELINRENF